MIKCCLFFLVQRTLQAALEKNNRSEDEMKVLTCRMQEKVQSLDELRRECCCSGMKDGQVQVMGAINDLDVFAKNEGGLVGMTRDINEIQKVVQVGENHALKLCFMSLSTAVNKQYPAKVNYFLR